MLLSQKQTAVYHCILTITKKKDPTQELDDTKITAEGNYFINFTKSKRKCCLNMHYNVSNRFLFVNATKISIQSKTLK